MENIQINTTQNVSLSYSVAGVGQRLLSIFLDGIFRGAYFVMIYFLNRYFFFNYNDEDYYARSETYNEVMWGISILLMLPGFLYHLLCETFLNGQSFGKKITKLKVVKLDGTQPNFGSYLIRSMFRIIENNIIGLVAIAASQKSQRIGDMVAGTTVIELNKKLTIKDTILSEQQPDYKIVYPQVALMSDTDANTIKEVIDFSQKQDKPEHLAMLAAKIKTKYGISEVSQNDLDFLNTLLMDYSHYQFER